MTAVKLERHRPELRPTSADAARANDAIEATPELDAVQVTASDGSEETVVVERPSGGDKGAGPRLLARYRLLSGAATQLRSRVAQMEARLSSLSNELRGRPQTARSGDLASLEGAVQALRGEESQIRAELSRLQAEMATEKS